jgi:hypothetical protein
MKHYLIIKSPETKVIVKSNYLKIITNNDTNIVSFIHIKSVFINIAIKTKLANLHKIALKVPLYLIDNNGKILSKLVIEDNNETV